MCYADDAAYEARSDDDLGRVVPDHGARLGIPAEHAAACEDAWKRVLAFLAGR
ncbi:hypothetical protein [Nonomuraea sp. JJY05]|jgi:hypothetical protein|uniref:hypothetical protein n=1 Tax=Nonomuraea sp. JJY05 TaxID=3350255 RepID=UPI00373FB001